jgi:hypothetical protein
MRGCAVEQVFGLGGQTVGGFSPVHRNAPIQGTRESGFYCIYVTRLTNLPDRWIVAEWHRGEWWAPGIGYPVPLENVQEIAFGIVLPRPRYH